MPSPPSAHSPAGPCVVVIFGASGDLAHRKLIPALENLAREGLLSSSFAVIGVATRPWTNEEFRSRLFRDGNAESPKLVSNTAREWLAQRMYYLSGDFQSPETFQRLRKLLTEIDQQHETKGNYLFYLSTAPQFFSKISQQLNDQKLTSETDGSWRRLIVEKPFGRDLGTAQALNGALLETLDEQQIYRIDHYLGKETVQNIVAFRFANGMFEPIWNRRYIDYVQITAAEDRGIGHRGRYYDQAGALRDMLPNHLFQLLTLTAMEPPISFDADAVRHEQVKILKAIQPLSPEDVRHSAVRGQYAASPSGEAVAYREEEFVVADSVTPTFVAVKLMVDNWRWSGVPFYLRTGKRLPQRSTEIVLCFKRAPFTLFRNMEMTHCAPNLLIVRIQPDEGISLSFDAKRPGAVMRLGNVEMDFSYQDYFDSPPQTGYERLLYDCMLGDATLFQRADMVEAAWSVVTPILKYWEATAPEDFPNYASGTWGPPAVDELLARDGFCWRHCE
ncbi:MAG: glucose-6-phosphate dehydrogenase [Pirellulaceae bacterium]